MTPLECYEIAINRRAAELNKLRRNKRPDVKTRHEIQHLTTQLGEMESNYAKLKQSLNNESVFREQVETHGRHEYKIALMVAERVVKHYSALAPDVAPKAGR